jgi:putative CocE/NonD family hydrolase
VDGPDGPALLQQAIAQHPPDGDPLGDVPFRDSVSKTTGLTWWLRSSPYTYLDAMKNSGIGVYAVANWDEAGTKHGAFFTAKHLGRQAKLLVGPAQHCQWAQVKSDTGFDIVVEELRFFDYWLKNVKNGVMEEAPVTYYTYNAPAGQAWRRASAWPLANEVRTTFYLGGGELMREKPAGAGKDEVGLNRLAETSTSTTGPREGAENRIFYQTAPLSADMEVTGHPVAQLWIAANVPDTDVVARLDDVAPDGTAKSYTMHGQLRASNRALAKAPYDHFGLPWHSHRAADAKPLVPGEAVELQFDLLPISYIFKAGHRVRLTLFFADPAAPTAPNANARITVLRGAARASSVTLPVIRAAN